MKKSISSVLLAFLFLTLFLTPCSAQDYWNGEEYFKNSSSQKEAANDLLTYINLVGNEQILDVGCGDGKITAEISEKIPKGTIVGIDISPSMIDFACKTFSPNHYPNLSFVLKDALDINYNKEFNIIFSFTVLQWIPDHHAFLALAHNSLKSSGILAITMPMGLPKTLEQAVTETMNLPQWSSYFHQFVTGWNFVEKMEYDKLLKANQFETIRLEVVPQKDIFPSRESFEIFLNQIFPYLRVLPQDLKKPFLTEVIDRFLELETPFPKGEVHWKILRLEVVAKKL